MVPPQVRTAIASLETKKAALMRNVAIANRADVERVCEGSRMGPPALPSGYVHAIQATDGGHIDSGQVILLRGFAVAPLLGCLGSWGGYCKVWCGSLARPAGCSE